MTSTAEMVPYESSLCAKIETDRFSTKQVHLFALM